MGLLDRASIRLLESLRLRVPARIAGTAQGGHKSPMLNTGVEFADHRAYIPGDDIRQIDWKAFARHKQLIMRTFTEERDARIYVLLDTSASMSRGEPSKLDVGKQIAASFAYLGMKQYDRVLTMPFSSELGSSSPPMRTKNELPVLEGILTPLEADGMTSFQSTVRAFAERHPTKGFVVIVSDLMQLSDLDEQVRTLGRFGHHVCVVRVSCKEDDEPPFRGEIEVVDAETGQKVRLTATKQLVEAYKKEVRAHVGRCRDACVRVGGRLVEAQVEQPLDKLLKHVLAIAAEGA